MQAAGLTLDQFHQALLEKYRVFFRTAPNIQVAILDHKTLVRAQGLVDKPGQYLVAPEGSLDEVIASAGGLQKSADQHPVARYARIVDGQYRAAVKLADYYSGSAASAPKWRGGETVFFQNEGDGIGDLLGVDKRYVQVMGQVRAPGEYPYRENANFFYYLVQAGGPTDRANMSDLVVMRTDGPKLQAIPFTMENPEKIPGIQGGDVVFVQADNPTSLQKDTTVFGNIGGFMSSMAAVLLVAGL
jgi:protein involved in polysaccharide export with SLBB domain